jgi:octaprenyl-diphosphate synthase
VSTSSESAVHDALRKYGTHIGIAFQIRDDLLDYIGRRTILGKPISADIKEKKLTLPIIYALRKGDRNSSKRALQMIGKGINHIDIEWLLDFVKAQGGIEYAEQKAREHIAQAKIALQQFPDTPAKQTLECFSEFVLQRDK